MQTNQEAWNSYVEYTKGLTESARALGFGAAAICWILKPEDGPPQGLLLLGLALCALFFILDATQYLFGALRTKWWIEAKEREYRQKNKSHTLDGDYSRPIDHDRPIYRLFLAKIIALICGYLVIVVYAIMEWL
jgi:hypothetical protein